MYLEIHVADKGLFDGVQLRETEREARVRLGLDLDPALANNTGQQLAPVGMHHHGSLVVVQAQIVGTLRSGRDPTAGFLQVDWNTKMHSESFRKLGRKQKKNSNVPRAKTSQNPIRSTNSRVVASSGP